MFEKIHQDADLFSIKRNSLSENGVDVSIDPGLFADPDGDVLDDERICILKLDAFHAYNSRDAHNPPPAIDNLVLVKCCDDSISVYLIELRCSQGRRPIRRLSVKEVEQKFLTAADDFIGRRYAKLFESVSIRDVRAYLVSDPWGLRGDASGADRFNKKIKLSSLDAYSSRRPIDVLGRKVIICPVLPPNPVISPC